VSKGAGLGASPSVMWKKMSWRDSTVIMDDRDFINAGSVAAMLSLRPIMAPIPTEVIILLRARNSLVDVTGKPYLHGGIAVALNVLRRLTMMVI
jgi:hypothetical protein